MKRPLTEAEQRAQLDAALAARDRKTEPTPAYVSTPRPMKPGQVEAYPEPRVRVYLVDKDGVELTAGGEPVVKDCPSECPTCGRHRRRE